MEWLSIYAPTFPYVAMMLVICLPMMLRMMSDGTCDGSGASRDEAARLREERSSVARHEAAHV